LRSIVYGNGLFVAIGNGSSLFSSEDGIAWTEQASSEFLSNVLFGNGMFLASAAATLAPQVYKSFVYGSTNGAVWTPLFTFDRLVTLATFGNGVFVAQTLDFPGRDILTSSDGVTWTDVFSGQNPGVSSSAYAGYGAGHFVLLGPDTVLSSTDGVTWTERPADVALALTEQAPHPALAFGNNSFLTVTRGTVQQSGRVVAPYSGPPQIASGGITRTETGAIQLTIGSLPGAAFVVESSTDLTTWSAVTNLVSPTGLMEFTDPAASDGSCRFYRIGSGSGASAAASLPANTSSP
jgi:hypothetical protein